jgi:hypothetical protein
MTYDPNLGDPVSRVRHAVGDIDAADPLRPDAEYAAVIAAVGEELAAAAMMESLAAEWAGSPENIAVAGVITVGYRAAETWAALAKGIRARADAAKAATRAPLPLFGVALAGPTRSAPPAPIDADADVSRD